MFSLALDDEIEHLPRIRIAFPNRRTIRLRLRMLIDVESSSSAIRVKRAFVEHAFDLYARRIHGHVATKRQRHLALAIFDYLIGQSVLDFFGAQRQSDDGHDDFFEACTAVHLDLGLISTFEPLVICQHCPSIFISSLIEIRVLLAPATTPAMLALFFEFYFLVFVFIDDGEAASTVIGKDDGLWAP